MKLKIYSILITILLALTMVGGVVAKAAPPRRPVILIGEYEEIQFMCHDGRPLQVELLSRPDPELWQAACVYYGIE